MDKIEKAEDLDCSEIKREIYEKVNKITIEYLNSIKDSLLLQLVGHIIDEKNKREHEEGSIDNFVE